MKKILAAVLGLVAVLVFVAPVSAQATTVYSSVYCKTALVGGGCTTPVLGVNLAGSTRNAVEIYISGGSWDACTWVMYDTTNNVSVFNHKEGENASGYFYVTGIGRTYKLTTSYCMGGLGQAWDY